MYRRVPLNYDFMHLQREQVLVQAYLTSKRVKETGMIALTIKGGTRGKVGQAPTTCICDRPNIIQLHITYHTWACMLSVYLKLMDCLPPPYMRSLELLS